MARSAGGGERLALNISRGFAAIRRFLGEANRGEIADLFSAGVTFSSLAAPCCSESASFCIALPDYFESADRSDSE